MAEKTNIISRDRSLTHSPVMTIVENEKEKIETHTGFEKSPNTGKRMPKRSLNVVKGFSETSSAEFLGSPS